MSRGIVRVVLVGVLGAWPSIAAGHDTWLLPARFQVPAGARIQLEPTSGMTFPRPKSSIQPDRLAATGLRIGGRRLPLDAGNPDRIALLSVQVLRDGKPLPRFAVSALPSPTIEPIMRSTDGEGRAAFTLDRPGPWLIRGTLIEPSSSPDADWHSLFTTLTVLVQPRDGP